VKQEGDDSVEKVTQWEYEECEMSVEEYKQIILMQQVIGEKTQAIVQSVTEFQKEAVIDEYTMQLIEEGLL
jgi:hypothetical protein